MDWIRFWYEYDWRYHKHLSSSERASERVTKWGSIARTTTLLEALLFCNHKINNPWWENTTNLLLECHCVDNICTLSTSNFLFSVEFFFLLHWLTTINNSLNCCASVLTSLTWSRFFHVNPWSMEDNRRTRSFRWHWFGFGVLVAIQIAQSRRTNKPLFSKSFQHLTKCFRQAANVNVNAIAKLVRCSIFTCRLVCRKLRVKLNFVKFKL